MFLPNDPGNAISFTKLPNLLPEFQAALNEARTGSGWDSHKLNQIVAHDYGFLGSFIAARIEEVAPEGGDTVQFLVVEFRPPQGRDLEKAERLLRGSRISGRSGSAAGLSEARGGLRLYLRLAHQE